jgi:hypothetical protein
MWDLQGILLYRSIEHRRDRDTSERIRIEDLVPYIYDRSTDPRIDPEAAKKLAA